MLSIYQKAQLYRALGGTTYIKHGRKNQTEDILKLNELVTETLTQIELGLNISLETLETLETLTDLVREVKGDDSFAYLRLVDLADLTESKNELLSSLYLNMRITAMYTKNKEHLELAMQVRHALNLDFTPKEEQEYIVNLLPRLEEFLSPVYLYTLRKSLGKLSALNLN